MDVHPSSTLSALVIYRAVDHNYLDEAVLALVSIFPDLT
jgi:hypothetical protein